MATEQPRSKYWLRRDDPPPFGVGDRVRCHPQYPDHGLRGDGVGEVVAVYYHDGALGWAARVRRPDGRESTDYMAFVFEPAGVAGYESGHAADLAALFLGGAP